MTAHPRSRKGFAGYDGVQLDLTLHEPDPEVRRADALQLLGAGAAPRAVLHALYGGDGTPPHLLLGIVRAAARGLPAASQAAVGAVRVLTPATIDELALLFEGETAALAAAVGSAPPLPEQAIQAACQEGTSCQVPRMTLANGQRVRIRKPFSAA